MNDDCPRTIDLSAYLDEELTNQERVLMQVHLATCPRCEAMLAGFTSDNRPRRIYVNNGGDIAIQRHPLMGLRIATICWRCCQARAESKAVAVAGAVAPAD